MGRGMSLLTVVFALTALLAPGAQVRDRDATWLAPVEEASRLNPLATRTDAAGGSYFVNAARLVTAKTAVGPRKRPT
jgi:hypothetical protein